MLTKVLTLVVVLIGLALGVETARMVHAHATGVDVTCAVNIHHALGFGLLATAGALLLSLRADRRGGLRFGAWLSRQWSRFTTWLALEAAGWRVGNTETFVGGCGACVVVGHNAPDGVLPDAPIYRRQPRPEGCENCPGCPDCYTNEKPCDCRDADGMIVRAEGVAVGDEETTR